MAQIIKLPFRSNTPYSFTTTVGANDFRIHIKYCISDDTYFLDIDIKRNNKYEPIIRCLSITCGCDLFIPFRHYGLGTFMVIPTDSRYYNEVPHSNTILSKFIMVWEHD